MLHLEDHFSFVSRSVARIALALSLSLVWACPKKTADLELDAARKAMDDARSRKASDCAGETFQAAEAALSEAQRLAQEGDIEAAKSKAVEAETLAQQASAASPPGCDQPQKAEEEAPKTDTTPVARDMTMEEILSTTVYFDYNDSTIRDDSKATLTRVAQTLAKSGGVAIEVEGHCDIRGSTEYNLHLGERRAQSVKKYLTSQGVAPNQVNTISYGEERPVDLGYSEEAHQKNRRAELRKAQ